MKRVILRALGAAFQKTNAGVESLNAKQVGGTGGKIAVDYGVVPADLLESPDSQPGQL